MICQRNKLSDNFSVFLNRSSIKINYEHTCIISLLALHKVSPGFDMVNVGKRSSDIFMNSDIFKFIKTVSLQFVIN